MPAAGWVNDTNDKRDFRLNILRLHDEKNAAEPTYAAALSAMGYPSQGFYHSVVNANKQVLCAHCHASEALGTGGAAGVPLNTPTSLTLTASGANPQFRVIQQPMHGTIGVAAKVATYFPDPDYSGPDVFTYIASGRWIEYALGLDPALPSPAKPVTIKTSGDLVNWTTGTILTNTTNELKVRDTVPANSSSGRFIRIEATRQTPNP